MDVVAKYRDYGIRLQRDLLLRYSPGSGLYLLPTAAAAQPAPTGSSGGALA